MPFITTTNPTRPTIVAAAIVLISSTPSLSAASTAKIVLGLPQSSSASVKREHSTLAQFVSAGHVLGFNIGGYFVSNGTYALRVEFEGAGTTRPTSDKDDRRSSRDGKKASPLSRVSYSEVWPGVGVAYEAVGAGIVRSTWTVAPNVDPAAIRLRYNRPVKVTASGDLDVRFESGAMTESRPVAWQEVDGERHPVVVAFDILASDLVSFRLGSYRRDLPLVIDPTLTWSTFLGGGGSDESYALAVDSSGNIFCAGSSGAPWGSPVRTFSSGDDAFVAKLSSSGGLIWNTFLGSSGLDRAYGLTVDHTGNVYVGGFSDASWGNPVRSYTGSLDAFAAKLSSSGVLIWNTFLGGFVADDFSRSIAVDGSGNVNVGGCSYASWGNPVRSYAGAIDAFAAKLSSSGVLIWNTFLGSASGDCGTGIAVDDGDNVYVNGWSRAIWGSPVRPITPGTDAFVAKLSSSGGLIWNTFLGGVDADQSFGIAVDGSRNVYVSGESFASWGNPIRTFTSGTDAFVAKLSSSGALIWNTFLGGAEGEQGRAIAVDVSGNVYVDGFSGASWGTPLRAFSSGEDAFVARLSSSGGLVWNTFLGSAKDEQGHAIAVDGSGNVYVSGYSDASWGSPVRPYSDFRDAFVANLATAAYVALGDSYSSGEGVPCFYKDSDTSSDRCHRSIIAYSHQLPYFPDVSSCKPEEVPENSPEGFLACSGATTDNVMAKTELNNATRGGVRLHGEQAQLERGLISPDTDLVTISVGGDDLGFGPTLEACLAASSWNPGPIYLNMADDCEDNLDATTLDGRLAALAVSLDETYEQIKTRVGPSTKVVVLGYPKLFSGSGVVCPEIQGTVYVVTGPVSLTLSSDIQKSIRAAASKLNSTVKTAAIAKGFTFVNVEDSFGSDDGFDKHELCSSPGASWINGLSDPPDGPNKAWAFHPNVFGQRLYGQRLRACLSANPPDYCTFPSTASANSALPVAVNVPSPAHSIGHLSVTTAQVDPCSSHGGFVLGQSVRLEGAGFAPNALVALRVFALGAQTVTDLNSVKADAEGVLDAATLLPDNLTTPDLTYFRVEGVGQYGEYRVLNAMFPIEQSFNADQDKDGVPEVCDNCSSVANANQADSDGDAVGDACDSCPTDPTNRCVKAAATFCGDVDCNEKRTASDALLTLKTAVGSNVKVYCPIQCETGLLSALPVGNEVCGDTNCDGNVTASDALQVLKSAVGQAVGLSCGAECD